jgi:hypothetical protein
VLVEIEAADGTLGIATGSGGIAVCSIIEPLETRGDGVCN